MAALGLLAAASPLAFAGTDPAQAPDFSASASAQGSHITYVINGLPLTNTPFDGGGPTAQVSVDTGLSQSSGYAAFPDPGPLIESGPGLVAGVLGGGVPGVLPPLPNLPSLPSYPLSVSSQAGVTPEQSAGSGSYEINSQSDNTSGQASATAGLSSAVVGSGGVLASKSTIQTDSSGNIVAKAVADIQGLAIGPLTIGEVKSVATATLSSDGTVTPKQSMTMTGVQIGGLPVAALTPDGFSAGGTTYPVPLNSSLEHILSGAGITMKFVAPTFDPKHGRVDAPALTITIPIVQTPQIPSVGSFSGTETYTFGEASAQMRGEGLPADQATSNPSSSGSASLPSSSSSSSSSSSTATSSGQTNVTGATTGSVGSGGSSAGAGTVPDQSSLPGDIASSSGAAAPPPAVAPAQSGDASGTVQALTPVARVGSQLDFRSAYLVGILSILMLIGTTQLVRHLGVAR